MIELSTSNNWYTAKSSTFLLVFFFLLFVISFNYSKCFMHLFFILKKFRFLFKLDFCYVRKNNKGL